MRRAIVAALIGCGSAVPIAERGQEDFHVRSFVPRRRAHSLLPGGIELLADLNLTNKASCVLKVPAVRMVSPSWQSNASAGLIDMRAQPGYDHVLIVARYDEHLDWLVDLLARWDWIKNVLILNKGPKILAPLPRDRVRIRLIDNVGREGESLLHYIIQEYDRLPKKIWFLQGDPMTHQPDMMDMFDPRTVDKYHRNFQPLTVQFAEYARIPDRLLAGEEVQLDSRVRQLYITASNGGIVFANGVNEDDPLAKSEGVYGFHGILDAMQTELNVKERSEVMRSLCSYLNMTAPNSTDTLIPYTMSAMFYVAQDAILKHPKKFYEDTRRWLIYDDVTGYTPLTNSPSGAGLDTCNYLRQGGRRGYLLERLWQYIFTGIQRPGETRPPLSISVQKIEKLIASQLAVAKS